MRVLFPALEMGISEGSWSCEQDTELEFQDSRFPHVHKSGLPTGKLTVNGCKLLYGCLEFSAETGLHLC